MQRKDFDKIAERLRNWGRWGAEDQRGTLNHIGPEALQRAANSVQSGKMFALGLNFDKNGPQPPGMRMNPQLYMTAIAQVMNPNFPEVVFSDDVVHMSLQCATQWDALSHAHYDGVLYNGCKACDVLSTAGASKNGVEHLANPGIMARGVLLDIARLKGVDRLEGGTLVTVDDLRAACDKQGVSIQAGDIVMVRTGHIDHFTIDRNMMSFYMNNPGVTTEVAEWLYDHSAAAIAADNLAVETTPMESFGGSEMPLPFHMLCLREMGLPLGEMWNLSPLAADCAADGKYTFLLAAPPLAITGAVGSPVNPVVLK
ncbi:cyclase family protein [Sphingomonas crocodyli]|uniref:Cyclase family protein n=1 Tax=Sphingomonas crocodyli TaxID=1979270 RepID=A0A437M8X0_9SPHN|nr:cyclase family protein [Sphingomonas crocodyli]RVT94168.1 cyclase family protein [Sphingomonas crocodyli]